MNKLENHLLSIKDERQKMIRPTLHPTYNVGIMYVIKNDRNYRLDFEEI
jgi:hypothetical protein